LANVLAEAKKQGKQITDEMATDTEYLLEQGRKNGKIANRLHEAEALAKKIRKQAQK